MTHHPENSLNTNKITYKTLRTSFDSHLKGLDKCERIALINTLQRDMRHISNPQYFGWSNSAAPLLIFHFATKRRASINPYPPIPLPPRMNFGESSLPNSSYLKRPVASTTRSITQLFFYVFLNHSRIFDRFIIIFSLMYNKADLVILMNDIWDFAMTVGMKTRQVCGEEAMRITRKS